MPDTEDLTSLAQEAPVLSDHDTPDWNAPETLTPEEPQLECIELESTPVSHVQDQLSENLVPRHGRRLCASWSLRTCRAHLSRHHIRDCCGSIFFLSRRRDYFSYFLIIMAYSVLYPGLFQSVIYLEQNVAGQVANSERSTWETVRFLLTSGGQYLFPGVLLMFFSICVPFIKGVLLIAGLAFGRKPRLLRFVARISKYQLVDMFVTIMLVGFLNNNFIKAEVRSGFYYFLTYCVCSILGSTILATGEDTREQLKPIGLLWGVLAFILVAAQCCLLVLPLFVVGPTYKKLKIDSINHSVGQLILWLFGNGFIPQALLVLVGVILLPIIAYIILPLMPLREAVKSRMISIAHEWALADTWFIAFLVGWTSFDTNVELKVQVSNGGTYFNLLYGCAAFLIIHCVIGRPHVHQLSDEAIAQANDQGQDIQFLARQVDKRNLKKTSFFVALATLALLPGAILIFLVQVQGVFDVDIPWLNRELAFHYDDVNGALQTYMPNTIGCCVDRPERCNDLIPAPPYPHPGVDQCYQVGNDNVLYLNTTSWYKGEITFAARWLTNLRSIKINGLADPHGSGFHMSALKIDDRMVVRFVTKGSWGKIPMSLYAANAIATYLDNQGHNCCEENRFTIQLQADCFSDFPYLRNLDVNIQLDHQEVVTLKILDMVFTLSDLTDVIKEQVTEKMMEFASMQYRYWSKESPMSFMEALNKLIQLNLAGTQLRCPPPADGFDPTWMHLIRQLDRRRTYGLQETSHTT